MELKKLKNIKMSYLVAALAEGVIILFLSDTFTHDEKNDEPAQIQEEKPPEADAETRLKSIIESIEGVSDVEVFITYENRGTKSIASFGEETVTSDGTKNTSSVRKEAVTVKDGSVQSPFVDEEILPEVRGVIISAKGIDSPELEVKITEAVSTALGVDVHKVSILSQN